MTGRPRTALVTGANRGIGAAIAQGLARTTDYRVVTGARRLEDAERAASEIAGLALQLDLSDPHACAASVGAFEERHGPIDVLINNAAILTQGDVGDLPIKAFEESLAVNVVGPFALISAIGPGMRERGWGRIVNLSSGWGSFAEGLGGPVAYSVSKPALNALTVVTARTLGPAVKVNAVCPGWVRTRMGGPDAARPPEKGAETPIWLATLPDDGPTGGFFRDRQPVAW